MASQETNHNSGSRPLVELSRSHDIVWVRGTVRDNQVHRHHAFQIAWSQQNTSSELTVEGTACPFQCVLIDSRVPHAIELERGLIALLDAASPLAKNLCERHLMHERFKVLDDFAFEPDRSHDAHIQQLIGSGSFISIDERIQDVLEWLDVMESEGRWDEITLERALQRVCLSQSRFLHLFSDHVGSPWRTYLVWRRALVAITLASQGTSLTQAAHQSGYADSAHFSRQCLALFGFSPMALVKNSQFVQSE